MRRAGTFLITLFIPFWILGQEVQTYYYGVNGRIIDSKENALKYKEVVQKKPGGAIIKTYRRTRTGWMITRTEKIGKNKDEHRLVRFREGTFFPRVYKREIKKIAANSYYFTDYKGERVLRKGGSLTEIPLTLDGKVTVYYDDETVASESNYSNNQLLSNNNWNIDGSPYIDNIFYSATEPPTHVYGDQFIQNYITARMAEEQFPLHEVDDELLIGCVIMETGELEGVRVLKGKVESVNRFFIQTMETLPGKWNPAVLEGDTVRYFITMPIKLTNDVPLLQSVELTKGGQIFWND